MELILIGLLYKQNNTALHFAARYAKSETIEFSINHNISVNIIDENNDTLLISACSAKDNIAIVRILLTHGADVNWANSQSNTALYFAA